MKIIADKATFDWKKILLAFLIFSVFYLVIGWSFTEKGESIFINKFIGKRQLNLWEGYSCWPVRFRPWPMITTLCSMWAAGLMAGIFLPKIKPEWSVWFFAGLMVPFSFLSPYTGNWSLYLDKKLLILLAITLISHPLSLYFGMKTGCNKIRPMIQFNRWHLVWLWPFIADYFVCFVYALFVDFSVQVVDWLQTAETFLVNYIKGNMNHLVLGKLTTSILLPSIFILVAGFKGFLEYLMILTYKIWKVPVMYAIKTGNTDYGNRWKNFGKWLLVLGILLGGIPLAVWTQYGGYWLIQKINTLEITQFLFRWFTVWGV